MMAYFVVMRERGPAWDWSRPMRAQEQWEAHAAFMDDLVNDGYIVVGGPLGGEDDAKRVLHVVRVPERTHVDAIHAVLANDPWTPMRLLHTAGIEPLTVLLGGF